MAMKRTISESCFEDSSNNCKKAILSRESSPVDLTCQYFTTKPETDPEPTQCYIEETDISSYGSYHGLLLDCDRISPTPPVTYYPSSRSSSQDFGSIGTSSTGRLSTIQFFSIVLEYVEEVSHYLVKVMDFTFGYLADSVNSIPAVYANIKSFLHSRLGIPWYHVGSFLKATKMFISDPDIRDATIGEGVAFIKSFLNTISPIVAPIDNIISDIYQFFENLLTMFKEYLIKLWMSLKRISNPCEFGKRSDHLFLCMECHKEHY